MNIQAVIFKKDSFTKRKADAWLKRHNHVRSKPSRDFKLSKSTPTAA